MTEEMMTQEDEQATAKILKLLEIAEENTRWRKAVEDLLNDDDVIISSMAPLRPVKTTWRKVKAFVGEETIDEKQSMYTDSLQKEIRFRLAMRNQQRWLSRELAKMNYSAAQNERMFGISELASLKAQLKKLSEE